VLASEGILLSPAIGAVPMSLSTVIGAVNAQLLRRAAVWREGCSWWHGLQADHPQEIPSEPSLPFGERRSAEGADRLDGIARAGKGRLGVNTSCIAPAVRGDMGRVQKTLERLSDTEGCVVLGAD
jgi:hypothetical protein